MSRGSGCKTRNLHTMAEIVSRELAREDDCRGRLVFGE